MAPALVRGKPGELEVLAPRDWITFRVGDVGEIELLVNGTPWSRLSIADLRHCSRSSKSPYYTNVRCMPGLCYCKDGIVYIQVSNKVGDVVYIVNLSIPVEELIEEAYRGAPPARFTTLSGRLQCLDGDVLTKELWSRMAEFRADDPRVKPYLDWLRRALRPFNVPGYNRVFDDTEGWAGEPIPGDTVVRIGVIRLYFGAALIITAYGVGDHADIVIHGTVLNESLWREAVARVEASVDYESPHYSGYLGTKEVHVLWRIHFRADNVYIDAGGRRIPVRHVYVLLEMPYPRVKSNWFGRIGESFIDLWGAELAYWITVARPAFALALRLSHPPGTDTTTLYKELIDIARRVVLTDVGFKSMDEEPPADVSPFIIRWYGRGLCADYTSSTVNFITWALDGVAVYAVGCLPNVSDLGHAVSLLLYPSSVFGTPGWYRLAYDLDGDGVNETLDLIQNICPELYTNDRWLPSVLAFNAKRAELPVVSVYNGGYPIPVSRYGYRDLVAFEAFGIDWVLDRLPSWLEMPWHERIWRLRDKLFIILTTECIDAKKRCPGDTVEAGRVTIGDYIVTICKFRVVNLSRPDPETLRDFFFANLDIYNITVALLERVPSGVFTPPSVKHVAETIDGLPTVYTVETLIPPLHPIVQKALGGETATERG